MTPREQAIADDRLYMSSASHCGVLILGISTLPPEVREKFLDTAIDGYKAHKNFALTALDGQRGEIRKNAKGSCWIVDLRSSRGSTLFAWSGDGVRYAGPRLEYTNGGAWCCGLVSATMPVDPIKAPKTVQYIKERLEKSIHL